MQVNASQRGNQKGQTLCSADTGYTFQGALVCPSRLWAAFQLAELRKAELCALMSTHPPQPKGRSESEYMFTELMGHVALQPQLLFSG